MQLKVCITNVSQGNMSHGNKIKIYKISYVLLYLQLKIQYNLIWGSGVGQLNYSVNFNFVTMGHVTLGHISNANFQLQNVFVVIFTIFLNLELIS